jgi:hypothetical protein
MASLTYSAIDICGAQFNRLDCDGNVLNGPNDVVITCGMVDITRTPVKDDDKENKDPNGNGGNCAYRTKKGKIIRHDIKLTLCSATDADLMELLGIYERVVNDNAVGIGVRPKCDDTECDCCGGDTACTNPGVSAIIWHTAWCGEDRRTDYPCVVETFARIKFDAGAVEVTRNGDFNTYTLSGETSKNPNWGNGPGCIYPIANGPLACDYSEHLTDVKYPGGCKCPACDEAGYAPIGTAVEGGNC